MQTAYYICKEGQKSGPFVIEQLRAMWQNGSITSDSFYWVEGMPDWKVISELTSTLQIQPPANIAQPVARPQPMTALIPIEEPEQHIPRPRIVCGPTKRYQFSVSENGAINFSSDTLSGAREGLDQMKLCKKSFQLKKKELQIKARQIRQQYTGYTRTRAPMVRGGGVIGMFIRDIQSADRSSIRSALDQALRPLEKEMNRIDRILLNLESIITQVSFQIKGFHAS